MSDDADNFIASLVHDLKPVRTLRPHTAIAFSLAALVVAAALPSSLFRMRADMLAGNLDPVFLLASGLFLLLAIAATYAVVGMARPLVGNRYEGWAWATATVALLPASALLKAVVAWVRGTEIRVEAGGVYCLLFGTSLGLLLGAVLTMWLRRGAPTSPARAGLLTGLASGSMGIFAFGLYCPDNDIMHIGVWHALVVLFSAGIGRVIVPRLIRW